MGDIPNGILMTYQSIIYSMSVLLSPSLPVCLMVYRYVHRREEIGRVLERVSVSISYSMGRSVGRVSYVSMRSLYSLPCLSLAVTVPD